MKQLTQQLKSGKMELLEVPFPILGKGQLLVRNHYSVISAGTEGKTVTDARKGYIAKAKSRKKEVKMVIDMMKLNGPMATYKLVMNKLEAPSPLGYSTSGEVIAVGEGCKGFNVGDFVACGGNSAFHSEIVAVPLNLCVKVPSIDYLKQASFVSLAAIAIQGIRQAEPAVGESVVIIGMGVIGQLTYKLLEASGAFPIGIDVSQDQVNACKEIGLSRVYNRSQEGIEDHISTLTRGVGADSIIITAGTSSTDPVEFAGEVARVKAKVVIVGVVPTGFSRPNYFKKELDLRMSFSFGPGRHNLSYEQKGLDYPIGHVRWTENRNMQSFIDLIANGNLNIDSLISHSFDFEDAHEAYEMILSRSEAFSGIVIEYDTSHELKKRVVLQNQPTLPGKATIGLIGAGAFAQGTLLPKMKDHCQFVGIVTRSGSTAKYVGDKYGFQYCASGAEELFKDTDINSIFITTQHNTHADYVLEAISSGKNVFVEKPLAIKEEDLFEIKKQYEAFSAKGSSLSLMVGFNRRFAPAVQAARSVLLDEQAKSITIRVNSKALKPGHWINDPEIGAGRIIGEACHFIDLAIYLSGSEVESVSAYALGDQKAMPNSTVVQLKMKNGSIASISYFSNGNDQVAKEFIEVYSGGSIVQIDNFKSMTVSGSSSKKQSFKGQDKGHATCVQSYLKSIEAGSNCPIPFEQSFMSTYITFKVLQSIAENRQITIPLYQDL